MFYPLHKNSTFFYQVVCNKKIDKKMAQQFISKKTLAWKEMIQKLVVENCLNFGQHSRLTSKKVTKYLVGTRVTTEIFKLYELRYLLLKIYPLIHNLFYNPRLNSPLEKKLLPNLFLQKAVTSSTSVKKIVKNKSSLRIINGATKKKHNFKRSKFSFRSKQKNLLPQILFATTTPAFAHIIKHAAQICNMPWHQNRWFNGFMTAGMPPTSRKNLWNFIDDDTQRQTSQYVTLKWKINKENHEKTREKIVYHGQSRWPSLVIIPDLFNNSMIVFSLQCDNNIICKRVAFSSIKSNFNLYFSPKFKINKQMFLISLNSQ